MQDSPLILQSDRNVTVNARNQNGHLTGQMVVDEFYAIFFNIFCVIMKMRAASWHWVCRAGTELQLTDDAQMVFSVPVHC